MSFLKLSRRKWLVGGFFGLFNVIGLGYLWRRFNAPSKDLKMMKFPLGFQWQTQEPFLFCVHHYDLYPKGTPEFGPAKALLSGRNIGQDFEERDGFRMYHGEAVPGFPVHPHRGFETITIVRKGYVDHADSMGAAGRYGEGDVQWMTAGSGVQHSEMFPLLRQDQDNHLELFQVWLNLPKRSKMVPPHFKMFWSEKIPKFSSADGKVQVDVIAGEFEHITSLAPPPDSWAADPKNETLILLIKMSSGGSLTLPAAKNAIRTVYFFSGRNLKIENELLERSTGVTVDASSPIKLYAQENETQVLVLQSKPIGEPVVQHGPFVMTSREEIMNTIADYQKSQFGGWSWPRYDMIHGAELKRFAKYPDGKMESPS